MAHSLIPSGIIPPIVTPLVPGESDVIDQAATKKVVEHLIRGGVDGIFALGTCGEFAAFNNRSKRLFLETVQESLEGRVPLLVGITDSSTERCLQFYREIVDLKPLCVVVSSPYYYSYSQSELESFFCRVADTVDVPVILYNIPQFTKNDIASQTLMNLAKHPNIIGLKDSSGNFSRFQELASIFKSEQFMLFQGIESLSAVSLLVGVDGLVPGLANLVPSWFVMLRNLADEKKWEEAYSLQEKINQLAKVFSYQPWLSGLKYAMEVLGLCSGKPHHPFTQLQPSDKLIISQLLNDLCFHHDN